MSRRFHAVAIDYDGTLTDQRRPERGVLSAIQAVRSSGVRAVLVTGRILEELRFDFPEVDDAFDAIVAENGAVVVRAGYPVEELAERVPVELEGALRARGVPSRRGRVILATDAIHADAATEEIGRLGLEAQIVRNRGALMVLPAGVTKGTGVVQVLEQLNLSPHSTVAMGDAENDHSLFDACELGIAVGNAVPALRARADLVLSPVDGTAVAQFLLGPLLADVPGVHPRRWQLSLGSTDGGSPVLIPASGINVEMYGPSGAGKSYLAGVIAEQLIAKRYIVCVIDPEGDHVPLAAIYRVVSIGGRSGLPDPAHAARLLADGVSVVVDLSFTPEARKREYSIALLDQLRTTREEHGLPHWIVVEEAHVPMPADRQGWWCHDTGATGFCLVSYQPELVCRHLTARADVAITLETPEHGTLRRRGDGLPVTFAPPPRMIPHVRHWHKYAGGSMPMERRFHFRDRRGLTGQTAGNVAEFLATTRHASEDVLRHHAKGNDFSRWLGDLCRNDEFAEAVRDTENRFATAGGPAATSTFRTELERLADALFATNR